MTAADPNLYRKCPVCKAETGEACTTRTGGKVVGGKFVPVRSPMNLTHLSRERRTGGAR